MTTTPEHFLSIASTPEPMLRRFLAVAKRLRAEREQGRANQPILAGKTLAMIFEKPSLRTRVSFEQAMLELGGHAMCLEQNMIGVGNRESPADIARVLSGMVQAISARLFSHETLIELSQHSGVPVINALTDLSHPCQALADVMTIADEFGDELKGRVVTYVGDGNNVARSLAVLCGKLGLDFNLASPPGYELEQSFADRIMSQVPGMNLCMSNDPREAVRYADVIYTDTWVSMGQEEEKAKRLKDFTGYQVNEQLLAAAPDRAIVLHCLPAYRGTEITDAVMDGPKSRVFPQAHNRLHAQKGLLATLLAGVAE